MAALDAIVFAAARLVGGVLTERATRFVEKRWPKSGRWGMNFEPVHCPECGELAPTVRRPRNRRQALWGGWTCHACGCEMDKYGVKIDRP